MNLAICIIAALGIVLMGVGYFGMKNAHDSGLVFIVGGLMFLLSSGASLYFMN